MEMRPFGRLIPPLTARRRLLDSTRPVGRVELCRIEEAFDRVAARSVRALRPVPAFARATWDGYAVRSRDTADARPDRPKGFQVVGELYAESAPAARLGRAEAVAIATGAPLPPGADGVVIFEEVERLGDRVRLTHPVVPGDRIARPGDDIPRGAQLVAAGDLLTPVALGAVAAAGLPSVAVFARPIIEVIPNGNELVAPGGRLRPGAIYESNNAAIAAIVTAAGGTPRLSPPLPDDPERIERALRSAVRRSDLVLATGGSSVGERDHLPRILPRIGTLLFHGVAVRPGKPTLAARAGGRLIVGLPGHPTSCLANMLWLVLPVLRRLAHRPGPGWSEEWATLGADAIAPTPGFSTVVPLALRGGRAFSTFHGSSAITSLRGATAFAILPPGGRTVRAGQRLRICRLDPPLGAGPAGGTVKSAGR